MYIFFQGFTETISSHRQLPRFKKLSCLISFLYVAGGPYRVSNGSIHAARHLPPPGKQLGRRRLQSERTSGSGVPGVYGTHAQRLHGWGAFLDRTFWHTFEKLELSLGYAMCKHPCANDSNFISKKWNICICKNQFKALSNL